MRTTTLGTLLLCGLGAVSCAPKLPTGAPVYLKVTSVEQFNLANNLSVPGYAPASGLQGRWGLLNISVAGNGVVVSPNIDIALGGTTFFFDDGPGGSAGQITGIMYGIQNTSATTSTEGTIDLFWNRANASYVTATCLSGVTCAPDAAAVALFTSGTFLARLKLASGIDPANPQTFTKSSMAMSAPGGLGQSDSFANVDTTMSGTWTAALNGDWFTTSFGTRDMRLRTTFSVDVTPWDRPGGTVGVRGNDPFRVFTH